MPQAEEGNRVSVNYICRLEDGTIFDDTTGRPLVFIIGENTVPLFLEKAVMGMEPGEVKRLRVPAAEVEDFPFQQEPAPQGEVFPAGTTSGDEEEFDIGVAEEAEPKRELDPEPVRTEMEPTEGEWREPPVREDLLFEIELMEIDDGGVRLGFDE